MGLGLMRCIKEVPRLASAGVNGGGRNIAAGNVRSSAGIDRILVRTHQGGLGQVLPIGGLLDLIAVAVMFLEDVGRVERLRETRHQGARTCTTGDSRSRAPAISSRS